MASVVIEIDDEKLYEAIQDADRLPDVLGEIASRITANANALGSSFRTGLFYDRSIGQRVGDTQPEYGGDVKRKGKAMVGIVHPMNYAAMKDNYEHNTLLKAAR